MIQLQLGITSKKGEKLAHLTVIANIIAKEDKVDFVKSELLKLVELTRKEQGCIQYIAHQEPENPTHFLMYEIWESAELLEVHKNNTALTTYVDVTKDAIADFTVQKMSVLS